MSITEDEACKCLKDAKRIGRGMLPKKKANDMADRMKLLAHPARLQILKILSKKDVCVCVLAELIGRNQPNISQHLAKLKDKGVIEDYPVGKLVFYRITDKKILKLIKSL